MADSAVFEWACEALERSSGLSRLQARGTMRLVLNNAGLDSKSIRVFQLRVVALRLLPKELRARGVEKADAIGEEIAQCPLSVNQPEARDPSSETEEVFKRLGRRE